jgi:hypothetical protein
MSGEERYEESGSLSDEESDAASDEESDAYTQEPDVDAAMQANPKFATLAAIALITTSVCEHQQREYLSDLCKVVLASDVSAAVFAEIAFDVGNYAAADLLFKLEWARYKGTNVVQNATDFYRRILYHNHNRGDVKYYVEAYLLANLKVSPNVINIATSFLYPGYRPGDLFTILQGTDFASSLEYPPSDS